MTHALIAVLLAQVVSQDAIGRAATPRAEAAEPILWVGGGGCGGRTPCFATIQSAIDAAAAAQTVRILPGQYVEQLVIKQKNADATGEAARIVIEADPAAPAGSVVLRGTRNRCEGGSSVDFDRSRYVTLRGLAVSGAGQRGVVLRGGARQNVAIHIERNRIFRGATRECSGGVDVGRGNPDTVIANNVIHAGGRNGIRFRDARGGSYLVVGNTIARNGWNGIAITRGARAEILNNLIVQNGSAPGRNAGRHGIWRQRGTPGDPAGVVLRGNLVCGNRLGEIDGPLLDDGDEQNQTPTGGEGPGVVASATCALPDELFARLAGADQQLDTADDDFAPAAGSPALDRGIDPRGALGVADRVVEADSLGEAARPRDDDGDDEAEFDVGAIEGAGPPAATPTPTVTAAPTASPTAAPTASPTAAPTASPTAAPGPSASPTPTVITPSPSPTPSATPTGTPVPTANGVPVAVDDAYTVRDGETLSVPAAGVLDNDSDPEGASLSAQLVDSPLLGTLTAFAPDGSFSYQPPAQFVQPSLDPVARLRVAHGLDGFGQVADFDRDGHPDVVYPEFGALRALDGETGARLFEYDPSDTTNVNVSGCNTFGSTTIAVGDLTGGGDVSLVRPLNCDQTQVAGSADRFFAVNASQITAGKVRATWVTDRLTQPHPDALVNASAPEPPVPPIRPDFAASAYSEPSLARLDAAGGVKVLARRLIGPSQGAYIARNASGAVESRRAGCRSVTGLAADEGRQCRVTWIIDGASGGVETVLTAPNASGEQDTTFWRPWRNNAPIVADLDGDGAVEIVSGSDVYRRVAGVWQLAWQTAFEPASVAVADLDGDGTAEIVQQQHNGSPRTSADVGIFIYRHDGTLLRRIPPKDVGEASLGFVSIADADGDGAPDILYTVDGVLYVYRSDGRLLWLFVIPDRPEPLPNGLTPAAVAPFGRSGETAPQVYDLDLDGRPEVILNAASRLYIFDGRDGTEKWSIDNEGGGFGAKTLALADFDADGHVDILAMTSNRWNCSIGGGPVPCRGNTLFVSGQDGNWAPGPKVFNQIHYRANAVDDAAQILFAPGNRRDFRRAAQQGSVTDPRLREGTTFTYRASDGSTASSPATVYVKINPENSPPSITSLPPTGFLSVTPYTRPVYQITATDPDPGDVLRYELVSTTHPFGSGPGRGVNVDPVTGLVDFYTGPCGSFGGGCIFNGDILVVVAAIDALGARDEQSFLLTIHPFPTAVPNVVGMLLQPAIDALLAASLRARVLLEIFDPAPAGTVLQQNPAGGTPNVAPGTSVELTLSKGAEPTPTPSPSPTPDPNATPTPVPTAGPPLASIVVEPANPLVLAGETRAFTATGVFADGTSADLTSQVAWQSSAPATATIGASGVASALAAGPATISASIDGISGATALTVVARVPGDFTDPTAAILSPVDGAEVTEPVDVIGTATDANFLRYELAYAPAGETSFTVIATGASPVSGGVVGRFDPTMLLNDLYTLRLTVTDRGGNEVSAESTVQVAREMKVGIFTIAYEDLDVPVAGIPIRLTRVYDSRDKRVGDFGVGWRLDVRTMQLRANRIQGAGWQVDFSSLTYTLVERGSHKVSLTLPGGRVEEFDFTPTPRISPLVPIPGLTARYTPRLGTVGTLEPLGNTSLIILAPQPGEVELLDDETLDPYAPTRFRYTSEDGTRYEIGTVTGVEKVTDPSGNVLTISAAGISHSAGIGITFDRDAKGRITRVVDPMGHSQTYQYDGNGDLVVHTDPIGNATRFTYDRRHGLLDIVNPLGIRPNRNEYDADGRLIAHIGPDGKRIEFTHDVAGRTETFTDRDGNPSIVVYDDDGNALSATDALGRTSSSTWDDRGNRLSETDPLGGTRSYAYDAAGRVTSSTDELGRTTTFAWNAQGRLVSATDPLGGTSTFTYDAAGRPLTQTQPSGAVTQLEWDAAGNLVRSVDALGRSTRFEYDALGRRTKSIDALGNEAVTTYDPNGRPLEIAVARTDGSGSTLVERQRLAWSAKGQLVEKTDPAGGITRYEYDAAGRRTAVIDPIGRRTTATYTAFGQLLSTTLPDGSTQTIAYDGNGRPVSTTDRAGRVTRFEYDALGRRVRTIQPDLSVISFEYDELGRRTAVIGPNGDRTETQYDAAGRRTKRIDALGGITTTAYDALGRVVGITDALGRTTQFDHDAAGRLVRTRYPDGTAVDASYDAAGQMLTRTDELGRTTEYRHDAVGRLVEVVDALGGSTTFAYDEAGNQVSRTDANGHTTLKEFDAVGRVIRTTSPRGVTTEVDWDAVGNLIAMTDPNGATTTFEYDAAGRMTAKHYPDLTTITLEYGPDGQRTRATDARGATTWEYDALGRVVRIVTPDAAAISYTYDANGNRTSVTAPSGTTTYSFDALGRTVAVQGPDGGAFAMSYDAIGNRTSVLRPSGVLSTYGHDLRDRLTSVTHALPGGATLERYDYDVDAAGQRVGVTEIDGRSTEYRYDSLRRLVEESVTAPGDTTRTTTHAYDPVGNRLLRTSTSGVIAYGYDEDDRLLAAGAATYEYDDNGNPIRRTASGIPVDFEYDFENRLRAASGAGVAVSYQYDVDGARVRETAGGVEKRLLVDPNRALSQVLEERDSSGGLVASYTQADVTLREIRGGAGADLLADGQSTTRAIAGAGGVSDTLDYDAFGVETGRTGTTPITHRFAGERFDPTLGLYNLRARDYDPSLGRFRTADPLSGVDTRPLSFNRYLYASGDPVNDSDPTGLMSISSMAELQIRMFLTTALAGLSITTFMAAKAAAYVGINIANGGIGVPDAALLSFSVSKFPPIRDPRLSGVALGLAAVGFAGTGGVDTLFPGGNEIWFYPFFGATTSIDFDATREADSYGPSGAIGAAFNVPSPDAYLGGFFILSGQVANGFISSKAPALAFLLGRNPAIFAGPTQDLHSKSSWGVSFVPDASVKSLKGTLRVLGSGYTYYPYVHVQSVDPSELSKYWNLDVPDPLKVQPRLPEGLS